MEMNASVETPLSNMAVNRRAIVTSHVLVMGQKYVEQVGEIVSTGQVCSIPKGYHSQS